MCKFGYMHAMTQDKVSYYHCAMRAVSQASTSTSHCAIECLNFRLSLLCLALHEF